MLKKHRESLMAVNLVDDDDLDDGFLDDEEVWDQARTLMKACVYTCL